MEIFSLNIMHKTQFMKYKKKRQYPCLPEYIKKISAYNIFDFYPEAM